MSITALFTLIMVAVLLRIFWLRLKAASNHSENFKKLPPKDQLAILKECLLNNPIETNLKNLAEFGEGQGLNLDIQSYRHFLKKQVELSKKKNALAEDNELFAEEARWMDKIPPLEFNEASEARDKGDQQGYILHSLEGISRLYSDEAILDHLDKLSADYPKALTLSKSYRELIELRDQSLADEVSLEKLRKAKQAWEDDLLNME